MKTLRLSRAIGVSVLLVLISGCNDTYTATVNLDKLMSLDSGRFGHLNTALVTTGDLVNLDMATKNAARVGRIHATTEKTVEFDTVDVVSSSGLDVQWTGTIPQGDLKTALEVAVKNSSELTLKNPSGIEVGNIMGALNAKDAKAQIDPLYADATSKNQLLAVVTKLITADDLHFTLDNGTSVQGSASSVKIGDYTLNVTYDADNALHIAATNAAKNGTGVFFKLSIISKGTDGKYIPVNINEPDLSGFNMTDLLNNKPLTAKHSIAHHKGRKRR